MRVVVRLLLPARRAVALACRAGQQDVVRRRFAEVGLLQVLAGVHRARVVGGVPLHRGWPVVCRKGDMHASLSGALGEAS
jgi:hypothetical protein